MGTECPGERTPVRYSGQQSGREEEAEDVRWSEADSLHGPKKPRLAGREESTTVLFPGYCGPSTVGGKLLELKNLDAEQRLRVGGELGMIPGKIARADVKAVMETLTGYSAHADQAGLVDWMWSGPPGAPEVPIAETVFISHGTPESRRQLAQARMRDCGQRPPHSE